MEHSDLHSALSAPSILPSLDSPINAAVFMVLHCLSSPLPLAFQGSTKPPPQSLLTTEFVFKTPSVSYCCNVKHSFYFPCLDMRRYICTMACKTERIRGEKSKARREIAEGRMETVESYVVCIRGWFVI